MTDREVAQLAKLKQAGASDELCLSLVTSGARSSVMTSAAANRRCSCRKRDIRDAQILEMAQSDQIDVLSGEAITLKLIGFSNPTVQEIIHRRIQGLPTMTSEQIGALEEHGHVRKTDTAAMIDRD